MNKPDKKKVQHLKLRVANPKQKSTESEIMAGMLGQTFLGFNAPNESAIAEHKAKLKNLKSDLAPPEQ